MGTKVPRVQQHPPESYLKSTPRKRIAIYSTNTESVRLRVQTCPFNHFDLNAFLILSGLTTAALLCTDTQAPKHLSTFPCQSTNTNKTYHHFFCRFACQPPSPRNFSSFLLFLSTTLVLAPTDNLTCLHVRLHPQQLGPIICDEILRGEAHVLQSLRIWSRHFGASDPDCGRV